MMSAIPECVIITTWHLEAIRQWMDDEDDNSEYRQLIFSKPLTGIGCLSETAVAHLEEFNYYQLLIKRKRVNFGYKYWVDIAYRADTGEPLLFVSHEGNIEEYYREMTTKKGTNG